MIDKRVLGVIGILAILAIVVLIIGLVSPSIGGGPGGKSFSALFDKLEQNETADWITLLDLPEDEFEEGEEIVVKDEIISMRTLHDDTYFRFLYTGDKWINETSGTNFIVSDDRDGIGVSGAVFEIRVDGKFTASFDVGDKVTLTTTVVEEDDKLVFDDDWEILVT